MITSNLRKRANFRIAAALLFAACSLFVIFSPRTSAEDGFGLPTIEVFSVKFSLSTDKIREGDQFAVIAEFNLPAKGDIYKDSISFAWTELGGARMLRVDYPPSKSLPDPAKPGATREAFEGKFAVKQVFETTGKAGESIHIRGKFNYQGCIGDQCYFPETRDVEFPVIKIEALLSGEKPVVIEAPAQSSTSQPENEGGGIFKGGKFRWFDLFLAFGFGVLVSFTPCVLPMTPVTSGIILSYSKPGKLNALVSSLIYVFGISIVFGILGAIIGMVGGAAQVAFNSVYVRGAIAVVFVALALSMFGLYEIKLPNALTSKAQELGGKTRKNFLGLFALGMVSAFVLSPCVAGPAAFILIWIATTGDFLLGFLMMFLLAWGMGVLLILAGTFTSLVPRSGPWMDKVKAIFGIIMLLAALYFIWPYIPHSVFFFGIAGVAVLGSVLLKCWAKMLPGSGAGPRVWRGVGFALVLVGLLFAASGVLLFFNYDLLGVKTDSIFTTGGKKAVEEALSSGKPVVVDYWADWCVSCRQMDVTVFKDRRIREEMNRFVAIRVDLSTAEPDEKELMKEQGVPALPRLVIFDSQGKMVQNLSEGDFGGSADRLLEILKQVK